MRKALLLALVLSANAHAAVTLTDAELDNVSAGGVVLSFIELNRISIRYSPAGFLYRGIDRFYQAATGNYKLGAPGSYGTTTGPINWGNVRQLNPVTVRTTP